MAVVLIVIVLFLVAGSLWLRVRRHRDDIFGIETKSSPVSLAVQELVATAGGVYLAMLALTSFLKMDMPEKVSLLQVGVDPLALASIGLAIIQPFATRLLTKFKQK